MSLILNIDTSMELAFVALAMNESVIAFSENSIQKDHAGFLHPAIKIIMENSGKQLCDLDAVAVTAGPGSYTGIRVGMATAKGLCFALSKPLITINTLELLAADAIYNHKGDGNYLFCPMIDARRMEVYTALYDKERKEVLSPTALVIDEDFYRKFPTGYDRVLFGSGAAKCKNLHMFNDAIFIENVNIPQAMAVISAECFGRNSFTDLIFSEPFYLKEFHNK